MLGRRQDVYILLKILKSCTASKATSYKVKFAVDRVLRGADPDEIGLGQAVRKVMEYRTIKNKFGSIHRDLGNKGFTGVKVTTTGFLFLRNNQGWLFIFRHKTELSANTFFQPCMMRKLWTMEIPRMTKLKSRVGFKL